jgi:hypothetical protein
MYQIGVRLRRAARGELLDYLDGTMPLVLAEARRPIQADALIPYRPETSSQELERCPICAERRKQKALSQKKWRKSRGNPFE